MGAERLLFQVLAQAYQGEHFHNTEPAGISYNKKTNTKGELGKHPNTSRHYGVLTFLERQVIEG